MSVGLNVIRGPIIEGQDVKLFARIITEDGTHLIRADIASGTHAIKVYDTAAQTPSTDLWIAGTAPADTDVIVTDLTTSGGWTVDSTGYNFSYTLLNADVTDGFEGGHTYRVEVTLDRTSGSDIYVAWELSADDILSI